MAKLADEEGTSGGGGLATLNNVLMQMRKNCNHPDLITSAFTAELNYPPPDVLAAQSGKLALLDRLLRRLHARGHKVLIFSQMTKMLDLLESFLSQSGHSACRLDGGVPYAARQEAIESFNSDPATWLFLLSTRAGGLGINLTAADTVVIYDSDWNPSADLQVGVCGCVGVCWMGGWVGARVAGRRAGTWPAARCAPMGAAHACLIAAASHATPPHPTPAGHPQAMDRCHRIGQTRPVLVFRLATSHSVEGRMLARAADKMALERLVIRKGVFKEVLELGGAHGGAAGADGGAKGTSLSASELLALLRADFAMDDVPQSGAVSDDTLKALLDRSWMENGGSGAAAAAAAAAAADKGGAAAAAAGAAGSSKARGRKGAAAAAAPAAAAAGPSTGGLPYPPSGVGYEVVQMADTNVLSNVN
jgi:hypothetical protein